MIYYMDPRIETLNPVYTSNIHLFLSATNLRVVIHPDDKALSGLDGVEIASTFVYLCSQRVVAVIALRLVDAE